MTEFRRRTALVTVLSTVLLLSLPAPAQDPGLEGVGLDGAEKMLRSKLTLVFLFEQYRPELAGNGEGLLQLEAEIQGALDTAGGYQGFQALRLELQLRWGKLLHSRGDDDQALDHFKVIIVAGNSATGFNEVAEISAAIYESRAEQFLQTGDDTKALENFELAEGLFRRSGHEKHAHEIAVRSTDIAAREGLKAYAARKYTSAFETLSTLAGKNPPGFAESKAGEALTWMNENTGVLTVTELQIPEEVPGQEVAGLPIRLKSTRGGEDMDRPYADEFRWVVGEYAFQVLGADGKSVLSLPVTLISSGGKVAIPSKLPDGMAFIPARGDGTQPFFIDRTEVTVGAFQKEFSGRRFKFNEAELPAHGITFAEAEKYAELVPGRKLPTFEQWRRAAFGDTGKKYPWAGDDSVKRNCAVGVRKPLPVGSFKGTANSYGLVDVAGNVWEWLSDEHAIGGGFMDRDLVSPYKVPKWDRKIDFLKDKRPSLRLYKTFTDAELRKKYDEYHVRADILQEVGFRCVLEF